MKIFGIGLSKTGTNSLTDALLRLGHTGKHYPSDNIFEAADIFDSLTDIPVARYYKELDKRHPGAKFILTIREKKSWLESMRKHMERRPPSTLGAWGKETREVVYGTLYFDAKKLGRVYDKHHLEIMSYFGDREDDLLIMNICEDDSETNWEKLCEFLGHDNIPSEPFPVSNAAPTEDPFIDVVYPYAAGGETWEEIRYSIRSIAKNFINLRNIWIVGDLPEWAENVHHIKKDRPYQDNDQAKNFDYTHSIFLAAMQPAISDFFLVVNDDHHILAPRTAQSIEETPIVRENMDIYTQVERDTHDRRWQTMLWRTYDRLKTSGFGGWNYENHIPVLVSKERILHCWSYFGYGNGDLIWKTAYFNMFPPSANQAWMSETTTLKAGFYDTGHSYKDIKEKGDAAIYMSYNDDGMNDDLKRYLQERFPEPSKYETSEKKDKSTK